MKADTPRVTVPVEPTVRMLNAGAAHMRDDALYTPNSVWSAMLSAAPAPEGGAALDRDTLIALIMEETTDDIVADGWDRLGKPNVLVQGCRYIRRNAPPSPEGYANPEASAKQFAGFIADRILNALREEAPTCKTCGGKGYTEYEGGEGEGYPSRPEIEACSCREEAPAEAGGGERLTISHAISTFHMLDMLTNSDPCIAAGAAFALTDHIIALRAQPPSREDAQPVGWDEGMERERREADYERGFRHGKKSAFDDAGSEPVAWRLRLLDAFGDGVWAVTTYKPSADEIQPLYTHPAPDALRVAVEALEDARTALVLAGETTEYPATVSSAIDGIDQALAALQAEQKGGA